MNGTETSARLACGFRARFRRGNHRLGHDPRRQWSMTQAPAKSMAFLYRAGRADGDARQRERNLLRPHLRTSLPDWHAT